MTSRRNGREATEKGLTSATLPATTVVTKIPAPVESKERSSTGFHIERLFETILVSVCLCVYKSLPNKAPTARPAVCGWEKAAIALKTSGAPLPRARNVTPLAQTGVKEKKTDKKQRNKSLRKRGTVNQICSLFNDQIKRNHSKWRTSNSSVVDDNERIQPHCVWGADS